AGQLRGPVFTARQRQELALDVWVKFTSRDPVRLLEVVKNGEVERRVPFQEWSRTGTLGSVRFRESGWFLVRAISDNSKTFRFASSGPFYVEVDEPKRRISRGSAQFFLDWVRERAGRVKLEDAGQRAEGLRYHRAAEEFWQDKVRRAHAPEEQPRGGCWLGEGGTPCYRDTVRTCHTRTDHGERRSEGANHQDATE